MYTVYVMCVCISAYNNKLIYVHSVHTCEDTHCSHSSSTDSDRPYPNVYEATEITMLESKQSI